MFIISGGCYDIFTVGAFTAHARKFGKGGLSRLLQQLQDQYTPEGTLSKVSKVRRGCQLVNNLHQLQIEIVKICERVCHEALQGDGESLTVATKELEEKVKNMITFVILICLFISQKAYLNINGM